MKKMYTSKILLIFFVFLAVLSTLVNVTTIVAAIIKKEGFFPASNFILQAIGITGVIHIKATKWVPKLTA